MDKIEVSQRAREKAFDAYMTCFETVPNDLWLQALLDGKHDGDEMAQAFARFERDILATRTDATPVAVEMVAELQLSAFLAGRGSIRTKANGNTHESSPGPTMDDYRRMARFALAEGWVDATPVAWMPIESAPKDGTPLLLFARSRYATASVRVVGWYIEEFGWIECAFGRNNPVGLVPTHWQHLPSFPNHIEEPRAMVPATDVTALVEALEWFLTGDRDVSGQALIYDGHWEEIATRIDNARQALAPFTKGQT